LTFVTDDDSEDGVDVEGSGESQRLARQDVGIVGAGAVGSFLARVLAERGFTIRAIAARRQAHAQALADRLPAGMAIAASPEEVTRRCNLVFLAVPDAMVESLASSLPWHNGQSAVHFSGARSTSALAAAGERGAQVAALHPLMTFPGTALDPPVSVLLDRLRGCYWALEAESAPLFEQLQKMVEALDGHVLALQAGSRVPYHLGAVFASNYVVAALGAACALWETFGTPREQALEALLPLLRGSVESLEEYGLPQALSGPVARGDTGTVAAHLAWLEREQEKARPTPGVAADAHGASQTAMVGAAAAAYRALAHLALLLAVEKRTLSSEQEAAMRTLLAGA
jgi:predicted short-subunit dehydrogenase-like oxidoreductase (DUF2520 family)